MDSKIVSRIMWWLALRGLLAILFGIVAFFYTGQTLVALAYVFGVFALLSGIATIVVAVRAGEAHQRWGWLAASGIVGVVAGVAALVWPGVTALAFMYLIAAWAIISGVAEIAFALAQPVTLVHPWLAGLSGVLSLAFGILVARWPRSGAIALTWLIGVYAITYGVMLLYYAVLLEGARSGAQALKHVGDRWATDRAHFRRDR